MSRRYGGGLGFNVSYWYSKSLDDLSAMNLSGAAAKPLAGENDLAQNPFDLDAEYGPSLFDARHRFVASASWAPRVPAGAPRGACARSLGGWQLNAIATHNSGTPFTVSDSTNVVAAGEQPADLGLRRRAGRTSSAIRTAARTPWTRGSAVRRSSGSNPLTQAGQFGNAGRNIARGPSYTNVDVVARAHVHAQRRRPAAVPRRSRSTSPTTPTSACRSPT